MARSWVNRLGPCECFRGLTMGCMEEGEAHNGENLSQTNVTCLTLKKIKREPVPPQLSRPVTCIPTTPWALGLLLSFPHSPLLSSLVSAPWEGSPEQGTGWRGHAVVMVPPPGGHKKCSIPLQPRVGCGWGLGLYP